MPNTMKGNPIYHEINVLQLEHIFASGITIISPIGKPESNKIADNVHKTVAIAMNKFELA